MYSTDHSRRFAPVFCRHHWLLGLFCLLLSGCYGPEPVASWSTAVQGVYAGQFSRDGQHALVGSIQHGGSLWRTLDAERLFNWNHSEEGVSAITALAFSPEGEFAVTAEGSTLVLWDVAAGRALRFFTAPGQIHYIALTPQATSALLGMDDGVALLFDIRNGGILKRLAQSDEILSQAISADGRYAAFGLNNRRFALWDLGTGDMVREMETQGRVLTLALSEDGGLAFLAVQHLDAGIYDMESGQMRSRLRYRSRFFNSYSSFLSARFYSGGEQLLTGNTTGALEMWETLDGRRQQRWLTPKSRSFGPTNFSVLAVAKRESDNEVLALSSNGSAHRFALLP